MSNHRIGITTTSVCAAILFAGAPVVGQPAARRLSGSSQLTAVRLHSAEQSIRVTFVMTGRVRYTSARTAQPSRITIDLPQTGLSPTFTKREILSVHPALIRVLITRSPGATRAALDLAAAGAHSVRVAENELIVEIKVRAKTPADPAASPPPLATAQASTGGRRLPAPAPASPPVAAPAPAPVPVPAPFPTRIEPLDPLRSQNTVRIPWVALPPNINDFTTADARSDTTRVTRFQQREPNDGEPASEETTAYLAYDSQHLYAIFVCRDASADVRGRLNPRDAIADDDHVAVYLDTFRDGRHAYVFASNPQGVQQDGVISEGGDVSYVPDMVWRSEGRLTADGFVVRIAIPFKSLRFSSASVQSWRIAVGRTIARRRERAFWPYITRGGMSFVGQMATLEGLKLISPGRNVQLSPYGTLARERSFEPFPTGSSSSEVRRGGLDAKVVIRNAVAIDAAINPDFSEVESDDPLVTANQRYELFRPEKRPFFMENAAIFESPVNVMFSRRIIDPDFGVRVTARSSGWAIGGLAANDRSASTQPASRLFTPGARIGVGRVQRLFGDRSNMGVSATEYATTSSRNRVLSFDGRAQLTSTVGVAGQAVRSDHQEPGTKRLVGQAYAAMLARTGSAFSYTGSYRDVDAAVRVPLGFVPRVDIRATDQYAGYVWQLGDDKAWSVGPAVNAVIHWNHAGQLQDRWTSGNVGFSRTGSLEAQLSRADSYERYGASVFRTEDTAVSLSNRVNEWLYVWGLYQRGTAINYSPPPALSPFLGAKQGAYGSITLRPSARLDIEQVVLHEQLDTLPDGRSPGGDLIFHTTILRSQANLQVTRSLTFRGAVDFNQLTSDQTLFAEKGRNGLTYDMLVRFVPSPGTAVYVGFNKRYQNVTLDPRPAASEIVAALPGTPIGQRIFVKVSYLFRL
jgi:Domain of unknown function (DUF5916)/AMIN domain